MHTRTASEFDLTTLKTFLAEIAENMLIQAADWVHNCEFITGNPGRTWVSQVGSKSQTLSCQKQGGTAKDWGEGRPKAFCKECREDTQEAFNKGCLEEQCAVKGQTNEETSGRQRQGKSQGLAIGDVSEGCILKGLSQGRERSVSWCEQRRQGPVCQGQG